MLKMVDESMFETKIAEYLALKSTSTKHAYEIAFNHFLKFYRKRGGKGFNL